MRLNVRKMVLAALFASLIVLCAWISIPIPPVAVTLQTFGVLMALGVLGGNWGTVAVLIYLTMGLVGMPVFAGFRGGAASLLEPAGGFLWGFLAGGLVYWAVQKLGSLPAMICAMAAVYLCGSWWFSVYAGTGILQAMAVCVLPWLIPDGLKLALAYTMAKRIRRTVKR